MNSKGDQGVIIAPLSDGPAYAVALPVARELARLEQATLRILLIAEPSTTTEEHLDRLGLDQDDLYGAILARAAGPVVPAALEAAERWPESTIVAALDAVAPPEAATGPESIEPPGDIPLGSDLEELLTAAPGPLVLVPPRERAREWTLKRLLVPHDGTPTSVHAVGPAVSLADSAGAECVVLHVASAGAEHPSEPGTMTTPLYIDQPQHEWPAWAREFRERLSAMIPTERIPITTMLATGDPGHEIVKFATDLGVDLVVLGWHGDLSGTRAETLKTVIREVTTPVMILRTTSE